ncbi:MAG: Gfo/Idh/MocA family protein [Planctomycetota bacterium]
MRTYTRRDLLRKASLAASAAFGVSLARVPLLHAARPGRERLGVAVIGCGGVGKRLPLFMARLQRLVAMVDIDDKAIATALETIKDTDAKPKIYHDYRRMLDECHKDLNVALIAAPDHHHAPAAVRAMERGLHTFSQKPLAHNIRECRILGEVAKRNKVFTAMGNQGHYGEGHHRLCEYVWAGAIGNVTEAHCIVDDSFGGYGGRPPSKPIPAHVHWNEWIGPAPYRDYHDDLHPERWRKWRQFGTGGLGDMGCHNLDGAFDALRLGQANRYTVECIHLKGGSHEMYPINIVLRWEFPARSDMPSVKVYAYEKADDIPESLRKLRRELRTPSRVGTILIGDKGYMYSGSFCLDTRILPVKKHREYPPPPKTMLRTGGALDEIFDAIEKGRSLTNDFTTTSGRLTEWILTGHLAAFAGVGKKLEWDVKKMECTNYPEINQYISRTYRKGWEV